MRTPLLLAVLLLRVCGGGELTSNALVAHHGGVVVPFEAHAVEVVARSDGDLEAWVVDADATVVPSQTVVVVVPSASAPQEVTLAWDPVSASYKGRAPSPVVEGAIDVRLVVAGAPPATVHVERIVIAAPAPSTVIVGGPPSVTVTPASRARVEVSSPRVEVHAPSPSVVVVPPSPPGVVIVPPSPPSVVVMPPRPGVIVVEGDHHDDHHDRGRHRGHDHHDEGTITVRPGVVGPSIRVEGGHGGRGGRGHGRGRH